MIRGLMVVVAAVALGVTAVGAQDATARRDLMRANGKALYQDIGKMVKGETPYSQATVDAALTQLEDNLKKVPAVWAPGSSKAPAQGGNFKTADKAWDSLPDFNAKAAATAKVVSDTRATIKDVDTLKAGATAINNSCGGCHELYRQRI